MDVGAYNAAYYQEHRDHLLARQVAYAALHKEEKRAYDADYHAAHSEEARERASRSQRWFTDNLNILKAAQGCTDCVTHEGQLDHHHLDPKTKRYKVSMMVSHSLESLFDEIAKCTVLCSPCHQSRTAAMKEG